MQRKDIVVVLDVLARIDECASEIKRLAVDTAQPALGIPEHSPILLWASKRYLTGKIAGLKETLKILMPVESLMHTDKGQWVKIGGYSVLIIAPGSYSVRAPVRAPVYVPFVEEQAGLKRVIDLVASAYIEAEDTSSLDEGLTQ